VASCSRLMADTDLARLRAFVGRSFLAADEGLWLEIRALLESLKPLGFLFEDAKEATPRPVSEKVRLAIDRNDVYIGILSRRDELVDYGGFRRFFSPPRRRWSPPPWVVQESGYALGVEKRVVLLIEEGVEFPTASLDADREWISFNRGAVPLIAPRLVALINHLIAERLPALPTGGAAQVIAPEAPPTPTEKRTRTFHSSSRRSTTFTKVTSLKPRSLSTSISEPLMTTRQRSGCPTSTSLRKRYTETGRVSKISNRA
jgi:hypothetical protein